MALRRRWPGSSPVGGASRFGCSEGVSGPFRIGSRTTRTALNGASKGSRSVPGRGRLGVPAGAAASRPCNDLRIDFRAGTPRPLIRFGVVPEVVQLKKPCSLEATEVESYGRRGQHMRPDARSCTVFNSRAQSSQASWTRKVRLSFWKMSRRCESTSEVLRDGLPGDLAHVVTGLPVHWRPDRPSRLRRAPRRRQWGALR